MPWHSKGLARWVKDFTMQTAICQCKSLTVEDVFERREKNLFQLFMAVESKSVRLFAWNDRRVEVVNSSQSSSFTTRGLSAAMILRQLFQNDPWSSKKMKEAEEFSADRPLNEPGSRNIPGQRKSNWIRTKLRNELANYSAPASSGEWLTSFNVSPSSFSAPPEKHQSRALWRLLIIFFSHTTLDEILSWFSLELIFLTRRRKQ